MPYIKLLTVLAGLALLTACGGGTGLTATNDTITPECMTNPFGDGCNRFAEALASQEIMCLADATADPSCVGDAGIATVFCKDNPFHNSNACRADTGAIRQRQTQCVEDATTNPTCGGVISNFCRTNPFQETACLPNDTYLPLRIADCITGGKADTPNCGLITRDATKNTTLTACLENPFDVACESLDDFMSSFTQARTNRASFCNDSANVADDLCKGDVVAGVCGLDPFTAICFTGNTYLSPRITNCITGGNAGESKCDTVFTESASNTCLTNPFTDACKTDSDFGTYADMARTNRVTFCESGSGEICTALTACQNNPFATECEAYFQTERDNRESFCDMAGNVGNALCMGASRMGVCGIDPFNASCFTEPTYLTARFNNCITGGNAGDMKCDTIVSDSTMNAEITACLTNPFSDACARNPDFDDYADMARANRVAFCESGSGELCTPLTTCNGNPFHESCGAYFAPAKIPHCAIRTNAGGDCATTLSNPNAATWAHSFATALSATPTTENQFLLGMATGIGTGDVTNIRINETLNLETATYKDVPLGGDAEDGVAYFSGQSGGSTYYNYAGIFSGTNLGAPITGTTGQTAAWNGEFRAFGSVAIPNKDFSLTVTFDAGGTSGTLDAFIKFTGTSTYHYKLDGVFNDKGVISGTVVLGDFTGNDKEMLVDNSDKTPGTLTGLIGQEGAVGAFHSNNDSIGILPYVGGFVARPAP